MKAFNKIAAALLLTAGSIAQQAYADNSVFTSMDDPSTAKSPLSVPLRQGIWPSQETAPAHH